MHEETEPFLHNPVESASTRVSGNLLESQAVRKDQSSHNLLKAIAGMFLGDGGGGGDDIYIYK